MRDHKKRWNWEHEIIVDTFAAIRRGETNLKEASIALGIPYKTLWEKFAQSSNRQQENHNNSTNSNNVNNSVSNSSSGGSSNSFSSSFRAAVSPPQLIAPEMIKLDAAAGIMMSREVGYLTDAIRSSNQSIGWLLPDEGLTYMKKESA